MTEPENTDQPLDPKAAMRQALERKKAAQHEGRQGFSVDREAGGHAHGQAGGKRVFRRKSGG